MSVREYIGARYIPLFADPIEWDSTSSYEPLTVVKNQGSSYVSRQFVPEGVAITNTNYWILWADFNAQIEQYRQEVQRFDGRITANADAIAAETEARAAADTALGEDISAETTARESADTIINEAIAAETTAREDAVSDLENEISEIKPSIIESTIELHQAWTNDALLYPVKIINAEGTPEFSQNVVLNGQAQVGYWNDNFALLRVAKSWYDNKDYLTYANEYPWTHGTLTELGYSPIPAHLHKIDGKGQLDCTSLALALSQYLLYNASTYYGTNSTNVMRTETVKMFNKQAGMYVTNPTNLPTRTTPYYEEAHLFSWTLARMLNDAGALEHYRSTTQLKPGTMLFMSYQEETGYSWWEGISHCAVVLDNLFGNVLVMDSSDISNPLRIYFLNDVMRERIRYVWHFPQYDWQDLSSTAAGATFATPNSASYAMARPNTARVTIKNAGSAAHQIRIGMKAPNTETETDIFNANVGAGSWICFNYFGSNIPLNLYCNEYTDLRISTNYSRYGGFVIPA